MSLLRADDYLKEHKKTRLSHGRVSTKTRLPTDNKTKPHNCSQCHRTDAKKCIISEKEFRWLCPKCIIKHNAQHSIEKKVNFLKASKLQVTY